MAADLQKPKKQPKRLAVIAEESCSGCGVCQEFCPVPGSILVLTAPEREPWKVMRVAEDLCIGCSLCAQYCPWECISMVNLSRQEAPLANDRHAVAQA